MIKVVIFDMDGVLVDTPKYVTIAFNQLLEKYGAHMDPEYRKKTIGRSLRDQIEMWRKDFNIKEEIDPIKFSKEAFAIELGLMKEKIKPDEYLLDLIRKLKDNNIKIAVATSSTKDRAIELLKLVDFFDKIDSLITAEDVNLHKPHPEIFIKTAEELGIEPENCIVIEDAVNGVQAANAAKMKSIAYLTPYHGIEEFKDIADMTIEDFSELDYEKIVGLFR
jgi:beta-phosphoglucomutase